MSIEPFLYKKCNDATLMTHDGTGMARLIGNIHVTGCDNITGDHCVTGNSEIVGNSSVDGNVTLDGNVVGNNNMYVPVINATNIYQPVNLGPVTSGNNISLTNDVTGTVYFINPSTITTLPFTYNFINPIVGTNYRFIVNGTFAGGNGISFSTPSVIVGNYNYCVSSITGQLTNPHPQTIGTPSFQDPNYTINNANVTVSMGVGALTVRQNVSTNTLSFPANHLSIGDTLTFIYTGSYWIINGLITNN
jgi:hypothetical protein